MTTCKLKGQIERYGRTQYMLIGVMASLFLLFYLVGYRPEDGQIRDLQGRISTAQQSLLVNRAQANNLPLVAEQVERLRARLATLKRLPSQPELGDFLQQVNQLSQQAQLHRLNVMPGVPKRSDLYCEQPIALTFQGDFLSVFTFLHQAEQLQRLTRVRNVSLKSIPEKPGDVTVELTMNIYYREG